MSGGGSRGFGVAFAIASAIFFGGSGPFAKPLIVEGLSPLHVTWIRVAGAALLMAPWMLRHAGAARRAPGLLLAYGVFAIAGVQAFYFGAIATIPVGVALLIEFIGPVLVLGWVRFVLHRRISRAATVGVALAVVGLALVVRVWAGITLHPVGLSLALGAACCQATYFLLSERTADIEPQALAAYGLFVGTFIVTIIARPWRMDWSVFAGQVELAHAHLPAGFAVIWIVLCSTVLAYLTGIVAVRGLSAPVAGGVAYLEPVVATLLAWWLLAETLGGLQVLGGVLVLAGAFLAQRAAPVTDGPDEPVVVQRGRRSRDPVDG